MHSTDRSSPFFPPGGTHSHVLQITDRHITIGLKLKTPAAASAAGAAGSLHFSPLAPYSVIFLRAHSFLLHPMQTDAIEKGDLFSLAAHSLVQEIDPSRRFFRSLSMDAFPYFLHHHLGKKEKGGNNKERPPLPPLITFVLWHLPTKRKEEERRLRIGKKSRAMCCVGEEGNMLPLSTVSLS